MSSDRAIVSGNLFQSEIVGANKGNNKSAYLKELA